MPEETYPTSDGVEAVVQRAGLGHLHNPDAGQHHHVLPEFVSNWGTTTPRDINNPAHVEEDLEHLNTLNKDGKPILDAKSFVSAYTPHEHPIEYLVHDADGNLKQRIYSHNIRTFVGAQWQAMLLGGDVPGANYWFGTGHASTAPTATTYTTAAALPSSPGVLTNANTGAQYGWPTLAAGANAFVGHMLVVGNWWAVIVGNTTAGVITIDKWHQASSAANAAGVSGTYTFGGQDGWVSTPGVGLNYVITPGMSPALFLALSTSTGTGTGTPSYQGDFVGQSLASTTTASTDWTSTELTAAAGLGRAANATAAYTLSYGPYLAAMSFKTQPVTTGAGVTTPSLTGVYLSTQQFISQGSNTVTKSGLFNTGVAQTGLLIFEANLSALASLIQGDQLTVSWSIQI